MNVAFRVDSSPSIGSGHLMRCLSLAGRLRECRAQVRFICRDFAGNLSQLVSSAGFALELLSRVASAPSGAPSSEWLGVSQEKDAEETLAALPSPVELLVIDHYSIGRPWEERLASKTGKILAIDDLADRPHACDFLLDQNERFNPEARYRDRVRAGCSLLLGAKYALLRKEFSRTRQLHPEPTRNQLERVLVFFGGADLPGLTGRALEALSRFPGLQADVVIGALNPRREELRSQAAQLPGVQLHESVADMSKLMLSADLALGAGGTSNWERLCVGLPSIVVSIAENQAAISRELGQMGWIDSVGSQEEVTPARLAERIRYWLDHPAQLKRASETAWRAVDGNGSRRVAWKLAYGAENLDARTATVEDSSLLFSWANDPVVRSASFQSRPIAKEEHDAWFARKLASRDSLILIFRAGLRPVGQVRFECREGQAEVGIAIDEQFRGQGLAPELLRLGANRLFEARSDVREIVAHIKPENLGSIRAFEGAGFDPNGERLVANQTSREYLLQRNAGSDG